MSSVALAQSARVDIRPGIDEGRWTAIGAYGSRAPVVQLGDAVYFAGETASEGSELWRAAVDGSGAKLVVDLVPGTSGSGPNPITIAGDRMFFAAGDASARRLYASDGTASGTMRSELFPNVSDSEHAWDFLGVEPGRLTAFASTEDGGAAVYQSDGRSVARLRGTLPAPHFGVQDVLAMNGGLLVVRNRTSQYVPEKELFFVSDKGVVSLGQLGTAEVQLQGLLDGRALYSVWNNATLAGLWITDGTTAGTVRVSELPATSGATAGRFFWFLRYEAPWTYALWRTDGTAAGTTLVRAGLKNATVMGGFKDRVVYVAAWEVWTTDGTEAGTAMLGHSAAAEPRIVEHAGFFYFSGLDNFVGTETSASGSSVLVRSDGTIAGTRSIPLVDESGKEFGVNTLLSLPAGVALVTQRDFAAELRLADADAELRLLARLSPNPASSDPLHLFAFGDSVLFSADDGVHGPELWMSNGTPAGTSLLADIQPGSSGSNPANFVLAGDQVRFTTLLGEWQTNGTAAGTKPVPDDPRFKGVELLGARWYSVVESSTRMGTVYGVRRYADGVETTILSGLDGPVSPIELNGRVVFSGRSNYAFALWSSTGGPADEVASLDGGVGVLNKVGDVAVFQVYGDPSTVWRTDGTAAGTGSLNVAGHSLSKAGSLVYFAGSEGSSGYEPWVTDGTPKGTHRVVDLAAGAASSEPHGFAEANAGIVFWADAGNGTALFATDGTAQGTRRISNVKPLPYDPVARDELWPIPGGRLAFAGWEPDGGAEPWVTDGTPEGTGRVIDLFAGERSSSPSGFVAAGDKVFFAAADSEAGRELHVLPLAAFVPGFAVPPSDAPAPTQRGLPGGVAEGAGTAVSGITQATLGPTAAGGCSSTGAGFFPLLAALVALRFRRAR